MTDEQQAEAIRTALDELNSAFRDAAESGLRVEASVEEGLFALAGAARHKYVEVSKIWRETKL